MNIVTLTLTLLIFIIEYIILLAVICKKVNVITPYYWKLYKRYFHIIGRKIYFSIFKTNPKFKVKFYTIEKEFPFTVLGIIVLFTLNIITNKITDDYLLTILDNLNIYKPVYLYIYNILYVMSLWPSYTVLITCLFLYIEIYSLIILISRTLLKFANKK